MRGEWFLLLLIIGATVCDMSRPSLHAEEGPALFFPFERSCLVEVQGVGYPLDGIHQLNDARGILAVIKMADPSPAIFPGLNLPVDEPCESGRRIEFQVVRGEIVAVEAGWMSAAKRIALGIPLSVDRMNRADWSDLPGVGASLALRIEANRQKNGDFDSFLSLRRVKGVGKKRLESWRKFFKVTEVAENKGQTALNR